MKKPFYYRAYALLLLLLTAGYAAAQPAGSTWTLSFEDTFDGTTLNTTKWSQGFGWGAKSGSFDETTRPENATVSNGTLKIKMECVGTAYWSGAINSRNKFSQRYGYWEARIKVPAGTAGLLPAFWMKHNDDKWPPELDILEVFGTDRRAAFTVHYGGAWPNNKSSEVKWDGGDLSTAFHTFGVEWDANAVKWYVDGVVRRTYARPEADEFLNQWNDHTAGAYMMLNIHAKNATWMGGNLSCSSLPRIMEVDYVRAYQKSGTTTPPPAPTALLQNPGFETGSLSPWTSWGNNSVVTSGQRSGSRAVMAWWNSTVEQVVTGLTPNTTYTFRGWGKVDAAGISARLSVKDHGGAQVYSPNFTSTTGYTQSSVTFTTGSSSTSARVVFLAPTNGGAWGDDFTLTAGTGSRVAYGDVSAAEEAGLRVHPNPAGRQFTLQLVARQAQQTQLALVDGLGRPVITRNIHLAAGPNHIPVNTEKVRPGTYLIRVEADGRKLVRKVVVGN
jgi:beta-glucanase (GH16 family)